MLSRVAGFRRAGKGSMAERSDDIDAFDFDFFEEPATEEAAQRREPRRGGPRRPVRPPSGLTPLLRLIGLIAFAIAVVLVLVLWAQSCRAESKREEFSAYLGDVRTVANESNRIGQELNTVFTTRGVKQADMAQRINALARRQQQGVARARRIEPPGRLRAEHRHAVDALVLRAAGLRLLSQAFAEGSATPTDGQGSTVPEPALLAEHMRRLLASDIVWDDLYREPALGVLRRQAVLGVTVPDSNFLAEPDLATARGLRPIVNRIRGATTGGTPSGQHGNGLVSVRALPGGTVLDEDADNNLTLTPDLQMEVTIENSGDSQEVQVPVRLTLQLSPEPITRTQVVNVIDPGEQRKVVFSDFADDVPIGQQTQLKVEVEPVAGERNTANNTAEYALTFLFAPTE